MRSLGSRSKTSRKHHNHQQVRIRQNAFTLVEIMFVVTIVGFISIGLTTFMTDSARSMLWSMNKSKITSDVRLFTIRLSKETLGANTAYVYNSFSSSDSNEYNDRRNSGQSGDCLVLVYTEPYPDIDSPNHYERIIAYYREPDSDGISPVYRSEVKFPTPLEITTNDGVDHFEKFLASKLRADPANTKTVLELSKGLSDGRLFRAAINGTFVVNGEIIHGENSHEMTNTYNLTVSPRG